MSDEPNSYDEVPYQSVSLVETHPERAATVATLFGLTPPDVTTCRVLELGCAGGGNLVPLAKILPNASFVGIDLSPRQIEQAEGLAKAAGVTNITFHAMSLTDVTKSFGEFDYIICHGVYSWVPDAVKEAILRISSENLARNGVAYVSYNTFPGWHVPGMVREMMLFHVRKVSDPATKVKAARAFLDYLGNNVPEKEGHYAKVLREESAQLKPHADSYVLHEHLEDLNHPIYFHEFAHRASSHGLNILGDSRFWTMASSVQPQMSAVLDQVSRDPIEREQYLDFLCNRRFRRTLLCHADHETLKLPTIETVKSLSASAIVWPTTTPTDFASRASVDFRAGDGVIRLSTVEPLFKTALLALTEAHPRSVPLPELWEMVKHRLSRTGMDVGATAELLALRMLQAHAANSVELHIYEPKMALTVSTKPEALVVARLSADTTAYVPNLRHRQIMISDFDRLVIRQLDGQKTIPEIVENLVQSVVQGQFTIQQNGLPVKDSAIVRPLMQKSLEPSLQRLMRAGLLVG